MPVPVINFVRSDKKENKEPSTLFPVKAPASKRKPRKCKECIQLLSLGLSTKDCQMCKRKMNSVQPSARQALQPVQVNTNTNETKDAQAFA